MTAVEISKHAQKDLRRVPPYIAEKARLWRMEVLTDGLAATQRNPRWGGRSQVRQVARCSSHMV